MEFDDEPFLTDIQRGAEGVGAMRPILRVAAAFPLAGRSDADVLAPGQLRTEVPGGPNLCPRTGGPGHGMNLTHGDCSYFNDSITSRINWRARNSGQLPTGR